MSSHEDFIKEVEAEVAQINSMLMKLEENQSEEDELELADIAEVVPSGVVESDWKSDTVETTLHLNQEVEHTEEIKTSEEEHKAVEEDMDIGEEGGREGGEEVDLAALLKDHQALMRKIDTVLQKGEEQEGVSEYEQFGEQTLGTLIEEGEEVEEEEDTLYKEMNRFVVSETEVDVEKLYDVLEMNLQYQDFLSKLNNEIQRRLQKNRDKQTQMGEEEDHRFLVSQGLVDPASKSRGTINSKLISLQKFRPPYFSNHYRIGPRMNPDQVRLSINPRYQIYLYESGWGKNDRTKLWDSVKKAVVDERVSEAQCSGQECDIELYQEQLNNSLPEELFSKQLLSTWSALQWQEVTHTMSSLGENRSAADCANQWNNYLSPHANKQEWGPQEDLKLRRLIEKHGINSWQLVASSLATGRRAWQCLQRYQKIKKKTPAMWTPTDDKHLTDAVMIYGEASFSDLSYYMGDKNSDQCLQRWRYSLRPQIKRGKWTKEEDREIMKIVSEHGFDWQKIKDVQKHRTRAQVRERVRILTAKDKSGSNGGARHWSVEETFLLMRLIKKHGNKNWSDIRKDFQLRYTAPVLFRRWNRIQTLLNGSCKRISLPWERVVMNELLQPKKHLTLALQSELGDMLPGQDEKKKIEEILERCKVQGRTALYKTQLKRRIQELGKGGEETEGDNLPTQLVPIRPANNEFQLLRANAGAIYRKAFEVGNDSQFQMYYAPPSSTTLSAFTSLLADHLPKLQQQAGLQPNEQVTLPAELLNSEEFSVLSARFKSLFSWPLIMGETPV